MSLTNFSLIPFDSASSPNITITGRVSRQENELSIQYVVAGDLGAIIIPSSTVNCDRQYDLWEHTCFEFFLGIKNQPEYWEFNLSPSGDWNVFHFSRYRENIAEEMNLNSLSCKTLQQDDFFNLSLTLDLNKLVTTEQHLETGITAVIEDQQKQLSYWALQHPATEADFHHRDSFAIDL